MTFERVAEIVGQIHRYIAGWLDRLGANSPRTCTHYLLRQCRSLPLFPHDSPLGSMSLAWASVRDRLGVRLHGIHLHRHDWVGLNISWLFLCVGNCLGAGGAMIYTGAVANPIFYLIMMSGVYNTVRANTHYT